MSRLPNKSRNTQRKLRVVFDCPGAAPLLLPHVQGGIGGAEVRSTTFADELARMPDCEIQFLVAGLKARKPRSHPSVSYASTRAVSDEAQIQLLMDRRDTESQGWPRAWHRLRSSLEKRCLGIPARVPFVEQLDADVLCTFGLTNRTAGVVRSARLSGLPTIVFLTSDRNIEDLKRVGQRDRGLYGELGSLCRYAVANATRIVVQTEQQQRQLLAATAVSSVLIRNPIDLEQRFNPEPKEFDVLWVGRADTCSKRADLAMKLARHCPQHRFTMIMNRHEESLFNRLMSDCPSNVTVVERVPFAEVEAYYAKARVLLNTSVAEGFPNSFLQAAKYGLPIVSLQVDPDRIIERFALGYVGVGAIAPTAIALREILENTGCRREIAKRGTNYVANFHSISDRASELRRVIDDVVDAGVLGSDSVEVRKAA